MNLRDINQMFHPYIKEYAFYLATHEGFSKMDHIQRHQTKFFQIQKD